ncbi:hypothetical protein FLW53_28535 [Microbispora sp. SCL1-1]|uniref:hypothetical protein n=1 Tax=unclassified Microbispora TaxID=2614687 RepID=UPI00115AD216|nr:MULTISPECIES: hypothetical protein [unclassified Microbispora]NJP28078.1 hypothetical protein [Microbispora sp. CL1-1]TQS09437.1 hypothetical protein FLW53_28535 [Microbispora sp. SCL1-1]
MAGDETTKVPTIGQVVGRNLAELRTQWGQTQKEAAEVLRADGLAWTAANVASIESGRRESIDLGALTLLAGSYDVPLSRFFHGNGEMRLSAEVTVDLRDYRQWLDGQARLSLTHTLRGSAAQRWINSLSSEVVSFQADAELAARLGLRPEDVYTAAEKLWGRNLHQERDRRLAEFGDMTPAQRRTRRGHITRQLAKELEPHLPAARS